MAFNPILPLNFRPGINVNVGQAPAIKPEYQPQPNMMFNPLLMKYAGLGIDQLLSSFAAPTKPIMPEPKTGLLPAESLATAITVLPDQSMFGGLIEMLKKNNLANWMNH